MNNAKLTQIKERAEKAARGEWINNRLDGNVEKFNEYTADWLVIAQNVDENDAEFIAHAREDVPALVAEVERLQRELTEVTEYADYKSELASHNLKLLVEQYRITDDLRSEVERLQSVIWRISDYCDLSVEETRRFINREGDDDEQ